MIPGNVPVSKVRDLTLNEGFDEYGRLKQMVGTTTPGLVTNGFGLDYLYPATEVVKKRGYRGLENIQPDSRHAPDALPPCKRPGPFKAAIQNCSRKVHTHRASDGDRNRTNSAGRRPSRCTRARSSR